MIETICHEKGCDHQYCVPGMRARVSKKPEPPPHQRRIPDPPRYKKGTTPKSYQKLLRKNSAVRARIARPIGNKETDQSLKHGTANCYSKRRCRCQPCVEANSEFHRKRYAMNKPSFRQFTQKMKERLNANRARPEWREGTNEELLELLRICAIKLEAAILSNDPKTLEHASDLSNHAFIFFDRSLKGGTKC